MLFSQSNSLTSMPEAKMILDSMFFTNSFASVVKSDVEIKTPFFDRLPCNAPEKHLGFRVACFSFQCFA